MSIQTKKYTSKKTKRMTTKYYAVVYSQIDNKPVWGPGRKSEREAKKDEARLTEELESGRYISRKLTFSEVATQWLESAKVTYSDSTYRGYEYYYHKYIENVFGDEYINNIQPIHIDKFKTEMLKMFSPETVNSMFTVLSDVFKYGITLHSNSNNPVRDITRAKVPKRKYTTWDEEEISYFLSLDIVKASPYYDMFFISLMAAMRPSEVCGLTLDDFLPDKKIITVTQGLNQYGNISDLKNTSSHRSIALTDSMISMLNNRIIARKKLLLSGTSIDSNFIFVQHNGRFINPGVYSKNLRKLIKRHNNYVDKVMIEQGKLPDGMRHLKQIRLYDMRHSFATNTLTSKVPVKIVSEVMGHSKIQTTLDTYCHLKPVMHRETINNYTEKITSRIS